MDISSSDVKKKKRKKISSSSANLVSCQIFLGYSENFLLGKVDVGDSLLSKTIQIALLVFLFMCRVSFP